MPAKKFNREIRAKGSSGEISLAVWSKNRRFHFRGSMPVESGSNQEDLGDWKRIDLTQNCYLIFGIATRNTSFTSQGEKICKLCFRDGKTQRTIRIYPTDFRRKDLMSMFKIIRAEFDLKRGQKATFDNTHKRLVTNG